MTNAKSLLKHDFIIIKLIPNISHIPHKLQTFWNLNALTLTISKTWVFTYPWYENSFGRVEVQVKPKGATTFCGRCVPETFYLTWNKMKRALESQNPFIHSRLYFSNNIQPKVGFDHNTITNIKRALKYCHGRPQLLSFKKQSSDFSETQMKDSLVTH